MVLQNLNLISDDGKLKNAALLLFAKKPQRYFTCVQFNIGRFGHSEADLITQDVIEGNIIQMADRVLDVLKSKYLTMPIRFEGMNRIEKLEVPEEALREILYNAIIHKDYTGVHGLPMPKIESAFGGVRVTFQRNNVNISQPDVVKSVVKDVVKGITERQRVILEMISTDSFMSAKAMSEKMSEKKFVAERTIQRDLADLQKKGIIMRKGGRFGGEWVIVESKE